MRTSEKDLISAWKDYITRLHRVFIRQTGAKAVLADFYSAIQSEIVYLRRQYPGIEGKKIVDRAYQRVLGAYERSVEYSLYLNWGSLAAFVSHTRPGIAWAVLQARADRSKGQKPTFKANEVPFLVEKERHTQLCWCPHCFLTAKVAQGRYECCGKRVTPQRDV